jgi:heme-degrading monooxygenase HmoA
VVLSDASGAEGINLTYKPVNQDLQSSHSILSKTQFTSRTRKFTRTLPKITSGYAFIITSIMADGPFTEFNTLSFKPDAAPDSAGTWTKLLKTLSSVPGVEAVYSGPKLEDPQSTVLVIQWASNTALTTFLSSEGFKSWYETYTSLIEVDNPVHVVLGDRWQLPLDSPTTEVFTAYGAEPPFIGNMAEFYEKVASVPMDGFHSAAYGPTKQEIAKVKGGDKAPAVMLVVGWDSKEAHLAAKAKEGNRQFFADSCLGGWAGHANALYSHCCEHRSAEERHEGSCPGMFASFSFFIYGY